MSVDGTPGTVLTRLEGTGYKVMLVSPKRQGWMLTIVAHILVGHFFLSEKYQIFYVLKEYKKLGLVDNVV